MHITNRIEASVARTQTTPLLLYIDDYIAACEAGSGMGRPLSDTTRRGYRKALVELDRLMGSPDLSRFTEQRVASVIVAKKKTSKSNARLLAAVAKTFSSWLYRKKFTEENRLEDLGVPAFNGRRHAFTDVEFRTIMSALPDLYNRSKRRARALVLLAMGSGLRSNEIRTLALQDVHITKPLSDSWALIRWHTTKTQQERMVCISEEAAYAIHEYIASDRPETDPADPLFISEDGHQFSYEGWQKMWARIADQMEEAGIKGFGAHRLRHQWATMGARGGMTQAMLEQQGGWGRGSKVPSRYIDVIPFEEMQKRGSPMSAFLRRVV